MIHGLHVRCLALWLGGMGLACSTLFAEEEAPVLPIGKIQGPVLAKHDGRKHYSPRSKKQVTVQGLVYQKTLNRTKAGTPMHGFYLQNTKATADERDVTSDGLWVYSKDSPRIGAAEGTYEPQVGDELVLRGKVRERYGQTQLQDVYLVRKVREGVDINVELPPVDVAPPDDWEDAGRYWERLEGMRCRIPSQSVVLGARSVFESTSDAEVWLVHRNHPVAQRTDPYARRSFRDAHPLDDVQDRLFDNGNGYRILVGSHGIKAEADNNLAMIKPVRSFDLLGADVIGGLSYGYGKYVIHAETQIETTSGPDPAEMDPLPKIDRTEMFSVATFNVYNLYDYRDDPTDGCDFRGNSGCPDVRKPLNYPPSSDAQYRQRIEKIAFVIHHELHAPDILMLQEIEDQDICAIHEGQLSTGDPSTEDGQLDVLQELATAIEASGGPRYHTASDRDGADYRGITSPFMYRSDRVELPTASSEDHVLGEHPRIPYRARGIGSNGDVSNPKALNAELPGDVERDQADGTELVLSRSVQVAHFRVWPQGAIGEGEAVEVYCLNNHFSSGPSRRVERRTEQARYNAVIVEALMKQAPGAHIVVGGDLNVFPRPDEPTAAEPSDQLGALYEAGLINTYDWVVERQPHSAYTSVYEGQANTLDQLFLSPSLHDRLHHVAIPHINSDWPKKETAPPGRGVSDHDPVVIYLRFEGSLDE